MFIRIPLIFPEKICSNFNSRDVNSRALQEVTVDRRTARQTDRRTAMQMYPPPSHSENIEAALSGPEPVLHVHHTHMLANLTGGRGGKRPPST